MAARPRRTRVLVATNEPWGTYHAQPLLAEAQPRGWELVQVVPDLSQIKPGDPVRVATLNDVPQADLLVVNGAEAWPADVAAALKRLDRKTRMSSAGWSVLCSRTTKATPAARPAAMQVRPTASMPVSMRDMP